MIQSYSYFLGLEGTAPCVETLKDRVDGILRARGMLLAQNSGVNNAVIQPAPIFVV